MGAVSCLGGGKLAGAKVAAAGKDFDEVGQMADFTDLRRPHPPRSEGEITATISVLLVAVLLCIIAPLQLGSRTTLR